LSLSYFLGFELSLGLLATLVFASWTIVRQGRANLAHTNLQRLVALEHQAFQDELIIIRADVARVAETADSTKETVTSIGHAVLEAMRKVETRLSALQNRAEKMGSRDDDRGRNVGESEIRELRTTLARISKSQKLVEERLSDEIRFNLERAKVSDESLRGFANRMATFAQRLTAWEREYNELPGPVGSLKQADLPPPTTTPPTERDEKSSGTRVAPPDTSQPEIPLVDATIEQSNDARSQEQADEDAACPSEEAA
jgi:hypothetical protein